MELQSQKAMFSNDPSTKGFDLSSGDKWFYPINYPERTYQFSIVKSALFRNTLVCLPTGLGKTFVAAVVMYNFWRWYPQGKIVFLAPTKPLVAQQINACHDVMGISSDETIELTGATDQKKRQIAWAQHRVIFATPQVFQKDLEKKIVPTELVKCVVVDEAHKALGKHSYCESIRLLSEQNQYFRVLGLSATPGGKLDAVQEVVRNLHIEHLELYDDTSPEIIPYINERKLDIILVGLGSELESFKDRYITIMDRHVRVLLENNVLRGNTGNISKGRIFMIQKEFSHSSHKGRNHGQIMKVLNILMTMYHAYDLMVRHGLRAFYNFYQNHQDKFWLKDEPELMKLLEEIIYYLGPFPDIRPLPDGSVPEIPEDIRFGHNKFQKLKDCLLRHFESFENREENTRAIVFTEYRDIVNELYVLLLQSRPLLRPQKFVGQAGQKQRQQKLALENFRSNKVNVLISTSVGEEGLDVGEVDLIVCFDISEHSPTRLVQRMGRTGRKRDGHIIVLVTDGKEHQTLRSAMSRRDSLNNKVMQSSGIIDALHETSPRMVPKEFNPECFKMQITILPKTAPRGKGKGKEAKKSRKRAENIKKTKNPKISQPSTSTAKPGSQSSLMKFLKRTRDEAELSDSDIEELTVKSPRIQITQNIRQCLQNNNTIKASNVKLLSTDDAAVEFLTLCTMKQSANESTKREKDKTNSYLPSSHARDEDIDSLFNFVIPDIETLECLKDITDYIAPISENIEDNLITSQERFLQNDDCYPIYNLTQRNEAPIEDYKFEALLDDSMSDSDATVFDPKEIRDNDFPLTEKVDWGANNDDLNFEDFADEYSNSFENFSKNNPGEENVDQIHSKFEDILNSTSNDSDVTYYSPGKENHSTERIITKNSVEIPNDKELRDSSKNSLIKSVTRKPFESILDDESIDLLKDCELEENSELSKNEVNQRHFKMITDELEASTSKAKDNCIPRNLEEEKGLSESGVEKFLETDLEVQNESGKNFEETKNVLDAQKVFVNSQKNSSCKEKSQLSEKRDRDNGISSNCEGKTENVTKENSTQISSSMITISQTLRDIDHRSWRENKLSESRVSTVDNSQSSSLSKNINETENILGSYKIDSQLEKNTESDEDIFGVEDLMVDSDFDEQISQIEKSFDSEINTSDKQFTALNKSNKSNNDVDDKNLKQVTQVNDSAKQTIDVNESLKRINNLKKSDNNLKEFNTSENEMFFDARTKVTDIQNDDCEILFVKETPKKFVPNLCKITPLRTKPKIELKTETPNSSGKQTKKFSETNSLIGSFSLSKKNVNSNISNDRRSSSVDDINMNFDWDEKELRVTNKNTSLLSVSSRKKNHNIENKVDDSVKVRSSTAIGSSIDDIIIDDFDWSNDRSRDCNSLPAVSSIARKHFEKRECSEKIDKNFLPERNFGDVVSNDETVERNSTLSVTEQNFHNDRNNKSDKNSPSPLAKSSTIEDFLDDCDWSSDFEVFSSKKEANSVESSRSKTLSNSAKNLRPSVEINRHEETTSLKSIEKSSKLRLTLGRKLTNNIVNKNTTTKQTNKVLSSKNDSDSENEFAGARIETAAVEEVASDYFVKPANPVGGSLGGMYNLRKASRGPLSLRRNDDNRINVDGLRNFSAPTKYTQQKIRERDTKKNKSLGAGRQKSASVDLDTRKKKSNEKNRKLRVRSEFIDDEAAVSSDENNTSGSSGVDEDLENFVSYTQNMEDSVDMQAHYLQTVRSPRKPGGFIMRKPKSPSPDLQIYSQALSNEPNDYLYDSFCVAEDDDDDDDDVFEDSENLGEITMLEQLCSKNKKRKRGCSADIRAKGKRKIVAPAPDLSSSEDEVENLRRQLLDESIALKNKYD